MPIVLLVVFCCLIVVLQGIFAAAVLSAAVFCVPFGLLIYGAWRVKKAIQKRRAGVDPGPMAMRR